MKVSIKVALIWSFLLVLLNYPRIFIFVLHISLCFVYFEYQGIFTKICNAQTGQKEEKYIRKFSNSIVPYFVIQGFLFFSSFSQINPERHLCISLFISTILLIILRIHQYSLFCNEVAEKKRKKKNIQRTKDDDQ